VVITKAWLRKRGLNASYAAVLLKHHTTINAVGTEFASLTITVSITGQNPYYAWLPMTVTDTTFTATDILGLCTFSVTTSAGIVDLIVRYKEK
jgi:hypothetical protein